MRLSHFPSSQIFDSALPTLQHTNRDSLRMARKNRAQKDAAAEATAAEEPTTTAQEGAEDEAPPAKKSKNQQHRKDKRASLSPSSACGVS